jgi:ankyrin repeat protein
VKKGAKMYYWEKQKRDNSPMWIAIKMQNVKAIELFCDHGADLTWKDLNGWTPLIFGAKYDYDDIVNYLTLRAKNLNVEDKEGTTIMIEYLLKSKIEMVKKVSLRIWP